MEPTQPSSIPPTQPAPQTPVAPAIPALPKQPDKFLPNRAIPTGFSPPAHGSSWGAFVGIVIIVIVLVVGALYFWGMQLEKQEAMENAEIEGASGAEELSR